VNCRKYLNRLSLSVGSYYLTWAEAKAYLNKYAKVVGFSLRQKRFKTDENDAVYTFW